MLIGKICSLSHTRMGFVRIIFPSKGPVRGQYCFFMTKYSNLYGRFLLQLLFFIQTQPLISIKILIS